MIAQPEPGMAQGGKVVVRDSGEGRRSDTVWLPLPGHLALVGNQIDSLAELRRYSPTERLRITIARDADRIRAYLDSLDNTPLAIMRRNLAMDSRVWLPTAADRRRRDDDIKRSQGWDKIFQNIPRVGVSVSTGSVFRALGLVEDVTPRISYTLMHTDSVSVKVYDIKSGLVATVVYGVQSPGEYRFDWDMNDASGHHVAAGDYVAEVIVGRRLVLRKRIEVP